MPKATPGKQGGTTVLVLQNASRSRRVPGLRSMRRWAQAALRPHTQAQVTVRVVGTAEGLRLNDAWRGRRYATNVLSFGYGRSGGVLQGDLVLCASVIAKEARAQGKRLAAHYAHLIVHGLLHLQGYDHEQDKAAERMERRERAILSRLGFRDPYSDRGSDPAVALQVPRPIPCRAPAG